MAETDLDLQEDVAEELAFDPAVDATKIGVAAENGVVTLTGFVPTYADKVAAENAAKRVAGVKGVASEIEVDLPAFHERTDTEIAEAALNLLAWDVTIPNDAIIVTVEDGWIILDGKVDWQYQKDHAAAVLRNLAGVRGITNQITVATAPLVEAIREQLRRALERHADVDAEQIAIEAHDGTVALRGTVHSLAERDAVTRAAYSVPGVKRVENETTVV